MLPIFRLFDVDSIIKYFLWGLIYLKLQLFSFRLLKGYFFKAKSAYSQHLEEYIKNIKA